MAVPSVPSVGSRATYLPAVPAPAPNPAAGLVGISLNPGAFGTPNALAPVDLPGSTTVGVPAIVLFPGSGPAPDFRGTTLLVFDQNGNTYVRTGVISVTTWAGQGSNPTVARFQLIDALS